MTEARSGARRILILAGLALGLGLAGFFAMRALRPNAAPVPAAPQPAAEAPPARAFAGSTGLDESRKGSSYSVVGGMSAEEAARRGITLPAEAGDPLAALAGRTAARGADGNPGTPPGPAGRPGSPEAAAPPPAGGEAPLGPPVALRFPADVQRAAGRYVCLCGCPHNLAVCDCNEQPIGTGTMLAYLEGQIRKDLTPVQVDAAMIDRYGPRVLAAGR